MINVPCDCNDLIVDRVLLCCSCCDLPHQSLLLVPDGYRFKPLFHCNTSVHGSSLCYYLVPSCLCPYLVAPVYSQGSGRREGGWRNTLVKHLFLCDALTFLLIWDRKRIHCRD